MVDSTWWDVKMEYKSAGIFQVLQLQRRKREYRSHRAIANHAGGKSNAQVQRIHFQRVVGGAKSILANNGDRTGDLAFGRTASVVAMVVESLFWNHLRFLCEIMFDFLACC